MSHSSLWHCSDVHSPPDESEDLFHLPGWLTWRNLNEAQAQASQLTPLLLTVYNTHVTQLALTLSSQIGTQYTSVCAEIIFATFAPLVNAKGITFRKGF
jgi:hypothetical protein